MRRVPIARGQHVRAERRDQARCLRRRQTRAETAFWELVRDRRLLGLKFRRQQVIQGFVVDFYCPQEQLVVEIDGDCHLQRSESDRERDMVFGALGLRVIRISNEEILHSEQDVIRKIKEQLK